MINIVRELSSRMGQRQEKGQTLIEYALIIALVVLAVLVVLGLLGGQIQTIFTTIKNVLAGAVPSS